MVQERQNAHSRYESALHEYANTCAELESHARRQRDPFKLGGPGEFVQTFPGRKAAE